MASQQQQQEEDVLMEVEALQSVYADDCIILHKFPPLLHIHIKPRTADVHSQQFVEATIEIRAGPQYPSDPPYVDIIGSKGLDEKRQQHLRASLLDKACELASCFMLVTLCEEAVEILSSMNHPEGDCPLCLYPLVPDEHSQSKPFMKIMSCFHCFHCDCIIRWLKWIQKQNGANSKTSRVVSSSVDEDNPQALDFSEMMEDNTGNCPVCRNVFLAKDIEHVLNPVDSSGLDSDDEKELSDKLLQCDLELSRRQKFEAILELQQQRGGLIEPPKDNILFTRISVQELAREAEAEAEAEALSQQQHGDQIVGEEPESSGPRGPTKEHYRGRRAPVRPASSRSHDRPYSGQPRHSGPRKHGRNNSKPLVKQWTRKD